MIYFVYRPALFQNIANCKRACHICMTFVFLRGGNARRTDFVQRKFQKLMVFIMTFEKEKFKRMYKYILTCFPLVSCNSSHRYRFLYVVAWSYWFRSKIIKSLNIIAKLKRYLTVQSLLSQACTCTSLFNIGLHIVGEWLRSSIVSVGKATKQSYENHQQCTNSWPCYSPLCKPRPN